MNLFLLQSCPSKLSPETFLAFLISAVDRLTEDTYLVRFALPGNSQLGLRPGQHLPPGPSPEAKPRAPGASLADPTHSGTRRLSSSGSLAFLSPNQPAISQYGRSSHDHEFNCSKQLSSESPGRTAACHCVLIPRLLLSRTKAPRRPSTATTEARAGSKSD